MVRKRRTPKGETAEYHYEFMQAGKRYYGVCEGCTTERAALAYEKKIRETAKAAGEQKSVKALIENFRDELTGGEAITLIDAFERYQNKPRKRVPGERQTQTTCTYWSDFIAFMADRYPEAVNLTDVTSKHAEEYISLLRDSGAFVKDITFTRKQGHKTVQATYKSKAKKLSPRTINARHKTVKAVFAWLASDAGLLRNPFDIPALDNDSISRDAFSDEELQLIGKNMTMPYTKPIFVIGLFTGLTLGDICFLRWDEIEDDWISNKRRRKTGTALDIPILPPLAAFLHEQRDITGEGDFVVPELAEMYRQNPSGVVLRVRTFLEGLGIATASRADGRSRSVSTKAAHAMRHTFAYIAGAYNVPQPIVQSILGHMTPAMTELYQRHASREAKSRFLQQMPDILSAPSLKKISPRLTLPEDTEPERRQLHEIVNELPLEAVKKILHYIETLKAL